MFRLIVTNDEEVVKFARARGAGVFTASKLPEDFATSQLKENGGNTLKVYDLLRQLNVKPNIKGYQYIKFLMEQCQKYPGYHELGITSDIYPECAEKFDTAPSRVERAIRHALMLSFETASHKYSEIFGGRFTKVPTNSEFIGLVAEYFAKNK